MRVLFSSLLGVCLLGLASAASGWDEYLDDGIPPAPVKLDEKERVPLIPDPSKSDCASFLLDGMLDEFESKDVAQTPKEIISRKTVLFCKDKLEKDATDNLAKLDSGVKERVQILVDSMIEANGGEDFQGERFYMPDRSIAEGMLAAVEQRGTDLPSIKSFNEFERKFRPIMDDCDEVNKKLAPVSKDYQVFLNRQKIQAERTIAQWVKNENVCAKMLDHFNSFGNTAYRLLEGRSQSSTSGTKSGAKSGSRLGKLNLFSRKS